MHLSMRAGREDRHVDGAPPVAWAFSTRAPAAPALLTPPKSARGRGWLSDAVRAQSHAWQ